jgi:hypothetical protein
MDVHYACEQFVNAYWEIFSGDGTLQERLAKAWKHIMLLKGAGLPAELQEIADEILRLLEDGKPAADAPSIEEGIRLLPKATAKVIVNRIWKLDAAFTDHIRG